MNFISTHLPKPKKECDMTSLLTFSYISVDQELMVFGRMSQNAHYAHYMLSGEEDLFYDLENSMLLAIAACKFSIFSQFTHHGPIL